MQKKITLLLSFFVISTTTSAQDHSHHKLHESKKATVVKIGTRFKADDNLKSRMEKVLGAVKGLHSKGNENDEAKIKEAGKLIETTVNDIFKNCKLDALADEAIHPVLGDLLEGAELLKKANLKAGHEKINHALLKYEELFIHDGWKH